jgi:hypothetical protein
MRLLLGLAAMFLLATFAPLKLFREPPIPAKARLWFEPVPLDADHPRRRRVGRLVYLGGWSLRSNDPRYGGISAIHVEDGALMALSDGAVLFRHALPGRVQGLPIEVQVLDPVEDKRQRDTEAMVVRGDAIWFAFERRNEVRRYDRRTLRLEAAQRPPLMRSWYRNSGAEALAALPGGRFLVASERSPRGPSYSDLLLFDGDPAAPGTQAVQMGMRGPEDYRVTDAAQLPDGRLIFLHRRFSYLDGISAKLTIAEPRDLKPGATFPVTEIADFGPPLTVDNLEGLSVTRENGRTILWIASDDNHLALQRTLLLKFALAD